MRLFEYIEDQGNRGRYSFEFRRTANAKTREKFDTGAGKGKELLFHVRRNLSDHLFIDTFLDQDFVDRYNLFVAGRRLNRQRMVWEYYVKSRSADEYRRMVAEELYHPPHVTIDQERNGDDVLYLVHHFEGRPLVTDFINNTMLGLEFLWGGPVKLETHEAVWKARGGREYPGSRPPDEEDQDELQLAWRKVIYTMRDRTLSKQTV
jgi:stage V sporulation protein R